MCDYNVFLKIDLEHEDLRVVRDLLEQRGPGSRPRAIHFEVIDVQEYQRVTRLDLLAAGYPAPDLKDIHHFSRYFSVCTIHSLSETTISDHCHVVGFERFEIWDGLDLKPRGMLKRIEEEHGWVDPRSKRAKELKAQKISENSSATSA